MKGLLRSIGGFITKKGNRKNKGPAGLVAHSHEPLLEGGSRVDLDYAAFREIVLIFFSKTSTFLFRSFKSFWLGTFKTFKIRS